MPDITMCANKDCLVRELCYRYRAMPSDYQSISLFTPDSNGLCRWFWQVTNERVRPLVEADIWVNGYHEQEDSNVKKSDIKD